MSDLGLRSGAVAEAQLHHNACRRGELPVLVMDAWLVHDCEYSRCGGS